MAKKPQDKDLKAAKAGAKAARSGAKAEAKLNAKAASADIKAYRRQVAFLKKKGLVSDRVDARKQRVTKHMLNKLHTYRDVISGRAAVVNTGSRKAAKEYREAGFKGMGNKVVVKKKAGSSRVMFDRAQGKIVEYREAFGQRIKSWISPLIAGGGLPPLPPNTGRKHYFYAVPFRSGPGGVAFSRFDNEGDLRQFMGGYSTYKNWESYIEVHEFDLRSGQFDEFDDEDAA